MLLNFKIFRRGPPVQEVGADVIDGVKKAIYKLTFKLQRKVKEEKLSGQVLKNRTGTLRRSITAEFDDDGLVGRVGTNVVYGRAHELGLNQDEKIKEHLRLAKQAFGRPLKHPVWVLVKPHTRRMVIPARPFLQPALNEIAPEVMPAIKASFDAGARNGA